MVVYFEFPFRFFFNAHSVFLALIVLCFNLAAPTQRIEVLFFTYNMVVKRHSDFIALGFLNGVGVMEDLGLLSVNPSWVKTIAASRISFNCCWLSHLPECLDNFLMFWRHLCSKRALLLNYWSIPIVFTWYLRRCYYNIPLRTTHWCSNVSIERTESIKLFIFLNVIHLAVWEVVQSFWKHIYSLTTGGNFVVGCKFNKLAGVEGIRCAWWFGVEVVGML